MTDRWDAVPTGGTVVQPGSAARNLTGSWRTRRPVIDFSRCTHCMICWVMCPDSCFRVEDKQLVGVDLDHCKGCGICAEQCPRECIAMDPETTGM
ncbi:MAG: 4Fe-4S binding protein [Chloroflexi bacterium]|nr:4Fe-4S binding protein [Chloroflexota bacterium]